jgi:hypothetical protein
VLFVFSRREVTRRNIAALRSVAPPHVFVVADGPRPGRPEDDDNCQAVRAVVDEIDWPCTIEKRYAETNIGLEASVELGLDWVFSKVDRAIVLEDDCIPDPTFFRYCEDLLERYADDRRVWQVGGDAHTVPAKVFGEDSYAFTTWASVWGWATWADRWQAHRAEFDRDHAGAAERVRESPRTAPARRKVPVRPADGALVTSAALRHFTFVAGEENGDAYGWDHHWWVTIMSRSGLSTTPAVTMIENDGYGEGATHTRAEKAPVPARPMPMPLRHPQTVSLNTDVERELELVLLRTDGRLSRLVRKVIRPFWLRSLVRRIVELPPVWWLVRKMVGR